MKKAEVETKKFLNLNLNLLFPRYPNEGNLVSPLLRNPFPVFKKLLYPYISKGMS